MILFLASCSIFVSSCKDDDDDHDHDHDHNATFVYHAHIMSPDTTDKNVGDEVSLHVVFEEHNMETVHHVNFRIYEDGNESNEIYNGPSDAHVHMTEKFELKDIITLDVDPHSDWIMEAKVWGETAGDHEVIETKKFHVHP